MVQPHASSTTRTLLLSLVALLALTLLSACGDTDDSTEEPPVTRMEGNIFGTVFQITLVGEYSEEELEELQTGIMDTFDGVDSQMSTYREDSDLNRLNDADVDEWVEIPAELYQVLEYGLLIGELTDGAFDMTVGGLVNLWTFGPEGRPTEIPSDEEIDERLETVGYDAVELHEDELKARRTRDVFVDLSAAAKGFGVDAVSEFLRDQGIGNFLVSIGGDTMGHGRRSPDRPWRMGIEIPHEGAQEARHVVPLDNLSVATSGDYRNFFEEDGQRYSHLIDPRTGRPIEHSLASASVFSPINMEADALATAFMIKGKEQSLEFAETHSIPVLLISRQRGEFQTHVSSAFKEMLDEEWLAPIMEYVDD